jgi:hypothetical protein
MQILLITLVIGAFVCILLLSFYYRIRVIKAYKILVQNRVQFDAKDIFDRQKVEEITNRYPKFKTEILDFMNNIRKSVRLASVLIFLITAFAAILMFIKE